MRLLEREPDADSRTLVYITRHSRPDFDKKSDHAKFQYRYWFEVCGWIRKWIGTSENAHAGDGELLGELLKLMEDWRMNGNITAGDLRAAVIYHTSLHGGQSLLEIVDQAWNESGIQDVLGETTGKWSYNYFKCWEYSPKIDRFGVRIGMGYWFDRGDPAWNATQLES